MAATFTAIKATPYSLVLDIAGVDGNVGTKDYGGAGGLATLVVPGPLADTLKRLASSSTLDSLNLNNANSGLVRARLVTGTAFTPVWPLQQDVHWTTTGLSAQATIGSDLIVEFRFQHSVDR